MPDRHKRNIRRNDQLRQVHCGTCSGESKERALGQLIHRSCSRRSGAGLLRLVRPQQGTQKSLPYDDHPVARMERAHRQWLRRRIQADLFGKLKSRNESRSRHVQRPGPGNGFQHSGQHLLLRCNNHGELMAEATMKQLFTLTSIFRQPRRLRRSVTVKVKIALLCVAFASASLLSAQVNCPVASATTSAPLVCQYPYSGSVLAIIYYGGNLPANTATDPIYQTLYQAGSATATPINASIATQLA